MAIEYKKSITLTKDSTIYGHQSLDEGGFPADAGNAKVSQVLDLAENQTVDTLKQSITITTDSSNTLLYHFNIGGESIATFTVPSDKFLKSVSYDTATRELVFTFVTSEGENVVRVDMSALVDTYTAGNGLALSGNVFSVRIKGTETRLSASSDGLSIDLSDIIALIDTERTQRQNTYTDLDARIVVIENKMTEIDAAVTTCTTKAQEASASASLASGHATTASEKATAASNSASLASGYATNANTYKTEAETAKNNAEAYASNASESADTASAKATEASTSASNASDSADTASEKATEASTSASNASASATLASTKATEASASASTASTKASEASASATKASASEANAKTSETNAKASATTASSKATEASSSASTASAKATEASTSASNASESADTASAKATEASTSASNASASATLASTKATEASASASTASTKASEASASATKASGYATEAISAKNTAKLWAISETIVESTDYSSKYYANKSKEYRDEAETFSKQLCYFRKQSYAVSASAGASAITIPSEAQYRPLADILFVHNKGVFLKEDTDYTKSDTGITLATALTAATTIEFDVLRAVSTESQSYDLLKGDKGDKGDTGNGVGSVVQTTTSTEDEGSNVVTVTMTDGTSAEFSIRNGSKGSKGDQGGVWTQAELLDLIYPIGSIYISVSDVSPGSFLGGSWTALSDGYTFWTASSSLGTAISAGLPNITGTIQRVMFGYTNSATGAFKSTSLSKIGEAWKTGSGADCIVITFKASDSNSIYSDSVTTVQPPAIRVKAWKRVS